ncbi:MAG: twin-arginine translocase TatA/TatE family subunit [Phycisphaerales bacterium]|nr:twin-arginine translocase TatA/TatE family subunit [Phycisphaerales bacterium]|tara:strand:- start:7 stop:309 length:303 start_codon:yes stop_codon:yes gene_type:complete
MSSITILPALLAIGGIGTTELIIIVVIGLLIFGRRLPEVGRNVGRSLVEFKKGVKGIDDDIDSGSNAQTSPKLTDQSVARHEGDVHKTAESVQNPGEKDH